MSRKGSPAAPDAESSPRCVFQLERSHSLEVVDQNLPPGFVVAWNPPRCLERTYLDTQDWRLWGAGATLLLERDGKGTALLWHPRQGSGVTSPALTPPRRAADLPMGTLRRELQPLLGERALLPMGVVRVRQRLGAVRNATGKAVVRAQWEVGVPLDAEGRPVSEGEVSLRLEGLRGYQGAWRRVLHQLGSALTFAPAEDTELLRAARARGRTPGDYTSRFTLSLAPESTAAEVTRLVLRQLWGAATANLAGAVQDLDPEFLHDLRVAVRRARSALGQLAGSYDPVRFAPLREELRWLGEVTGPCRDADVFLADLERYREELGEPTRTDLVPMLEQLRQQRSRHHGELVAALTSARAGRTLELWRRLTAPSRRPWQAPHASLPARQFGAARVQRAYRRLRRHTRRLGPDAPAEGLHRLRIDAKKLRYLLEFFASLLGPTATALIGDLKRVQDALGTFNDLAVQQQRVLNGLADLLAASALAPATVLAVGRLAALLEARQQGQRPAVLAQLADFLASDARASVASLGGGEEV